MSIDNWGTGAADPEEPKVEITNHEHGCLKNSSMPGRRRSAWIDHAADDCHLIPALQ